MKKLLIKFYLPLTLFLITICINTGQMVFASQFQTGQLALVQYNGDEHFGDYKTNIKNLTRLASEAVSAKANIIVFPEGSSWGYASPNELWCRFEGSFGGKTCRNIKNIAEEIPHGKTTLYWKDFAQKNNVTIVFHIPEREQNKYYNSIGVVGPEGQVTKYRKRMLYWVDKAYAEPGKKPVILETPYGNFGLMICMDIHSDGQFFDEYKNLNAQAIIFSTDWDQDVDSPTNAKDFFLLKAVRNNFDIFASDVSPWDGTGLYPANGEGRIRNGLPEEAINKEGISIHPLNY